MDAVGFAEEEATVLAEYVCEAAVDTMADIENIKIESAEFVEELPA